MAWVGGRTGKRKKENAGFLERKRNGIFFPFSSSLSLEQSEKTREIETYVEAVSDVEEEVDQDTVTVSLELKVPEEDIGLEQSQSLINNVLLVSLGRRGRATDLGLQGEHEDVADGLVVALVEARVVGLFAEKKKKKEKKKFKENSSKISLQKSGGKMNVGGGNSGMKGGEHDGMGQKW